MKTNWMIEIQMFPSKNDLIYKTHEKIINKTNSKFLIEIVFIPQKLKPIILDHACLIETLYEYFESGCNKNRNRLEWGLKWRFIWIGNVYGMKN